jgi:hypothetical protein
MCRVQDVVTDADQSNSDWGRGCHFGRMSAAKPLSESIIVTWRRSAVSWGLAPVSGDCGGAWAKPASSPMAANIFRRCPSRTAYLLQIPIGQISRIMLPVPLPFMSRPCLSVREIGKFIFLSCAETAQRRVQSDASREPCQ